MELLFEVHPSVLSIWNVLSYEHGLSVIISGYALKKLKKKKRNNVMLSRSPSFKSLHSAQM